MLNWIIIIFVNHNNPNANKTGNEKTIMNSAKNTGAIKTTIAYINFATVGLNNPRIFLNSIIYDPQNKSSTNNIARIGNVQARKNPATHNQNNQWYHFIIMSIFSFSIEELTSYRHHRPSTLKADPPRPSPPTLDRTQVERTSRIRQLRILRDYFK